MTFEENLKKLEDVVRKMESGTMPLDDMIKSFEQGRALVEACRKDLESIRLRIEKVTASGGVAEVPLKTNEGGETDIDL